jgi:hypothetical protein
LILDALTAIKANIDIIRQAGKTMPGFGAKKPVFSGFYSANPEQVLFLHRKKEENERVATNYNAINILYIILIIEG